MIKSLHGSQQIKKMTTGATAQVASYLACQTLHHNTNRHQGVEVVDKTEEQLSKALDCSRSTIQRAIVLLKREGLITVHKKPSEIKGMPLHQNLYEFNVETYMQLYCTIAELISFRLSALDEKRYMEIIQARKEFNIEIMAENHRMPQNESYEKRKKREKMRVRARVISHEENEVKGGGEPLPILSSEEVQLIEEAKDVIQYFNQTVGKKKNVRLDEKNTYHLDYVKRFLKYPERRSVMEAKCYLDKVCQNPVSMSFIFESTVLRVFEYYFYRKVMEPTEETKKVTPMVSFKQIAYIWNTKVADPHGLPRVVENDNNRYYAFGFLKEKCEGKLEKMEKYFTEYLVPWVKGKSLPHFNFKEALNFKLANYLIAKNLVDGEKAADRRAIKKKKEGKMVADIPSWSDIHSVILNSTLADEAHVDVKSLLNALLSDQKYSALPYMAQAKADYLGFDVERFMITELLSLPLPLRQSIAKLLLMYPKSFLDFFGWIRPTLEGHKIVANAFTLRHIFSCFDEVKLKECGFEW